MALGDTYRDLIILWTAMGLMEKEMAPMLGVSFKTVAWHKTVLRRDYGLTCIADITRYAIRNGYIEA